MELSEPTILATRPEFRTDKQVGADDPLFAGFNSELADKGFLFTSTDKLISWARTGSMYWMTFGLACCAVAVRRHYCETDIVNTYRVWLRYELFRGRLTEAELDGSKKFFNQSAGRVGLSNAECARRRYSRHCVAILTTCYRLSELQLFAREVIITRAKNFPLLGQNEP